MKSPKKFDLIDSNYVKYLNDDELATDSIIEIKDQDKNIIFDHFNTKTKTFETKFFETNENIRTFTMKMDQFLLLKKKFL